MRMLNPGQTSPSLLFRQDLIDRFHHMHPNLMQEREMAYGFHRRKIIDPQVISVKWEEKKYSGVVFGRDKKTRKEGNDFTSGSFLNFEP